MFGEQLKIRYPAGAMQLSAGICFIDDGEETFEKILEGANLARKLAKEQNVGAVVYRDDMRKKRDEGIRITGRFYAALQRGEFEVYLQPKFLLREERVYGAEALARWRLESGEILSPARFIPALENIGWIFIFWNSCFGQCAAGGIPEENCLRSPPIFPGEILRTAATILSNACRIPCSGTGLIRAT